VLLALLGTPMSPEVLTALNQAGAVVHVTTDMPSLRRQAAVVGPAAGLLVYADGSIPAHVLSPVLRRQATVVVVSPSAGAGARAELVASGADCAQQSLWPDEAVQLLAVLLRRRREGGPEEAFALHVGGLRVDRDSHTATLDDRVLSLTALEFDLLWYFMSYHGHALSRERLLADVWGYDIGGLETVTVHVRRLRTKIEADPANPRLIHTVWGVGYRLHVSD
jgi:DNA-binding response OmpR family regulator